MPDTRIGQPWAAEAPGRVGRRLRPQQCARPVSRQAMAGRGEPACGRDRRDLNGGYRAPGLAQRRGGEDHPPSGPGRPCQIRSSARRARSSWWTRHRRRGASLHCTGWPSRWPAAAVAPSRGGFLRQPARLGAGDGRARRYLSPAHRARRRLTPPTSWSPSAPGVQACQPQ
jgi:hypothetical protein